MDDILGMSLSDITDNDFPFETEIEEAKNMDMVIPDINLNLEELEFDFEDMQNFGPWIEADIDVNNIEDIKKKLNVTIDTTLPDSRYLDTASS